MKFRVVIVAMLVSFAIAVSALAQDTPAPQPPVLNKHELLHKYVWSTLGFEGALDATLWSAFEQWRGSPASWDTDAGGYARRWVSDYAGSAIGSTTKYGTARLFHHDPSFVRCACTGIGWRLRHAIAAPFEARTRDGRTVFSPATVAGITAENVIPASTWYPAPRGARDGALHAMSGVLSKMAVDAFREFVPLHRKPAASNARD